MEGAELILAVVPQRYPFLMIDRIVSHELRKKAICQKNVTLGEEILAGHFPGKPIYPGVMLVEMGLQATQIMLTDLETVRSGTAPGGGAEQGLLLMIEKFKFLKPALPGDVIRIESEHETEALGMIKARITLTNQDGETLAYGMVTVGGGQE